MIGLREYERDAALPVVAGRAGEAPLGTERLVEVAQRALRPDAPRITGAEWTYARWIPGKVTTAVYSLAFEDGGERIVVAKRYADGRHRGARARGDADTRLEEHCDRIAPRTVIDELGLVLWGFPADRVLVGHLDLLDDRKLARWIEDHGLAAPRSVRRRRLARTLLRYKPEHRSVWRIEVATREEHRSSFEVAARVLRPEAARRVAQVRRAEGAIGSSGLAPALLAWDEAGIVVEEWLSIETFDSATFEHARTAGATLARLHGLALPADSAPTKPRAFHGERALLGTFDELARPGAVPSAPTASRVTTWVHGDFHPDQVARDDRGAWRLLDLDAAAIGDPLRDLATWVADQLEERPSCAFEAAAGELLAGYEVEGGRGVDDRTLRLIVADELVRSAAGALRRLEVGARDKAARLIEASRALRAEAAAPFVSTGPATGATAGASPAPIHAAVHAVGRVLGLDGRAAAERVRRVDVRAPKDLTLTVDVDGGARWFVANGTGVREVRPADDAKVAVARAIDAERDTLLSYRPGRRIVLARRADGSGESVTYVKGYRAGRAAEAVRRHAVAEAAEGFRVPRIVAYDEDLDAVEFAALTGDFATVDLAHGERFGDVGRALARFQRTAAIDELGRFRFADELRVLDEWADRARYANGALPAYWDGQRARARAALDALEDAAPCAAHRDLHDGQLFFAEDAIGAIDFDLASAADPTLDLANLSAHLELRAMQGLATPDASRVCSERLLEGYASASGVALDDPGFAARRTFHVATTFLRLALVYAVRPRWSAIVPRLVRRAAGELDALSSPRSPR